MRITLFVAVINFLAKLGNDGMISPFVLGRTNNNQQVLGMVQSAVALKILSHFFGSGNGSGIAVMFFSVGILGIVVSLSRLRKPVYRDLNQ